jgi:hypothetical protein
MGEKLLYRTHLIHEVFHHEPPCRARRLRGRDAKLLFDADQHRRRRSVVAVAVAIVVVVAPRGEVLLERDGDGFVRRRAHHHSERSTRRVRFVRPCHSRRRASFVLAPIVPELGERRPQGRAAFVPIKVVVVDVLVVPRVLVLGQIF